MPAKQTEQKVSLASPQSKNLVPPAEKTQRKHSLLIEEKMVAYICKIHTISKQYRQKQCCKDNYQDRHGGWEWGLLMLPSTCSKIMAGIRLLVCQSVALKSQRSALEIGKTSNSRATRPATCGPTHANCSVFHSAAVSGFAAVGVKTAHSLVYIWARASTAAVSPNHFHLPLSHDRVLKWLGALTLPRGHRSISILLLSAH